MAGRIPSDASEKGERMPQDLLPTTVVGSYPQPDWLVNREMLSKGVPRVRMNLWRVPEPWLEQAQDDATLLAIRDMERAGIDIVTDGEIRRESYSNRFATSLEGIEIEKPGVVRSRSGRRTPVPRVVGKIRRRSPVEVRDMSFLRAATDRPAKVTLPGPFTMAQQAINEFYDDADEMVMDYAAAVNAEAKDLVKAGADIIQLDEPWLRQDPDAARRIAVKAINRALQGITVPTIVHLCFGYAALVSGDSKPVGYSFLPELADSTADQISIEAAQPKGLDLGVLSDLAPKKILLGVLDLGDPRVETPKKVAERIRRGLKHLPAERLIPAPDCGMKYLSREVAFGKLKAMADGAAIVRAELS
jgi:5-methyltetrahydropteroyltriglutamate--homocysteine methyltransferase